MARHKGQAAIGTLDAQALAKRLGIDPFEILLMFAANQHEKLGYKDEKAISPDLRAVCAERAAQYLLPKRKAVEFDIKELPDQAFDQEIERRVHLKILKGEIKASDVG